VHLAQVMVQGGPAHAKPTGQRHIRLAPNSVPPLNAGIASDGSTLLRMAPRPGSAGLDARDLTGLLKVGLCWDWGEPEVCPSGRAGVLERVGVPIASGWHQ